eukprot:838102-Amphidinium_carterae.1
MEQNVRVRGACEDDHFSERSTVCTNTSDNGMGHPRQTSSSSSMSDETHVSSAQSAASPQHEERECCCLGCPYRTSSNKPSPFGHWKRCGKSADYSRDGLLEMLVSMSWT